MPSHPHATLLLALAVIVSPAIAQPEIVYNVPAPASVSLLWVTAEPGETSSTDERPDGFEFESQNAQRILLQGSARRVTRIETWVSRFAANNQPLTLSATVRVYRPEPAGTEILPGALLWQGTVSNVNLSTGGSGTAVPVSFDLDTVMPDSIILAFSVSEVAITNPPPGLIFGHAGVIRSLSPAVADPWMFVQETATGAWRRDPNTSPSSQFHFAARITAIPASPTLVGLVAGLGLVATRARRRSRN